MTANISSSIPKLKKLLKNCNIKRGSRFQELINDDCVVVSIAEICHNLLRGNIVCDHKYLKTIRPFKKTIRKLGAKKVKCATSVYKNRDILLQKGGNIFLATLLPPLINAVGNYFIDKISERNN